MPASTREMETLLDVLKVCDGFPHPDPLRPTASEYTQAVASLYKFYVPYDSEPQGVLIARIVAIIPWTSNFSVDHEAKTVSLLPASSSPDFSSAGLEALSRHCNKALAEVCSLTRAQNPSLRLPPATDEYYRIPGTFIPDVVIERRASELFGVIRPGAHMTVYVRDATTDELRFWISKRSKSRSKHPGMYDNTVGGGMSNGESPFECIIREAEEEAGLNQGRLRREIRAGGTITYVEISERVAGGETGLACPGLIYVYDLEIKEGETLKVEEGEAEGFELLRVKEVKERMLKGQFKPNCASVVIDFWIRHGILTAENERDYVEICQRLHRPLPFRTTPGSHPEHVPAEVV